VIPHNPKKILKNVAQAMDANSAILRKPGKQNLIVFKVSELTVD